MVLLKSRTRRHLSSRRDVGEMFGEASPQEGRPRSGYARIRSRFRRVVSHYEELSSQYTVLQRELEALKFAHQELQAGFDQLLELHNGLLADLKRARSVPPMPAPNMLMGSQ